jgi:hypothetical protein
MRGQNLEGDSVTSNKDSSLTPQRSIHSAIHERVVEGDSVTSNTDSSLTTQRSIHSTIHERVVAQQELERPATSLCK